MRVIPQGGAPKRVGTRQVTRSPPLKHTTVHDAQLWKHWKFGRHGWQHM